ncbi:DUF5789 family protein [Candidatus Halobonum tyrrellensis]|uniref:DUF2795 domain-containing protein n=1 Tax=Candidatus Halobonum tyrrellensis G22 TaxID=1324957 RepID=V4HA70_9EURY|nr:hypothetical protein [Candidatus Halobonum tyrrellensis]ESP86948.1 hypothetical protein K933_16847 [Candidatus Halobonum tyrrellensis G22]
MADESGDGASEEGQVPEREQGVEFGEDLSNALEGHDYPTTTEELVSEYGDYELTFPDGETRTFEEVMSIQQGGDDYEEPRDVQQAVMNSVGSGAVGREGYSDRGSGTAPDEEDQESV